MADDRRRVVGSYDNRKDAVTVIQRLKEDGYQKKLNNGIYECRTSR